MNQPKTWFWISLSCGLYWLAYGMIRPVIALYSLSLGTDKMTTSIILSIFSFLPMLLAIPSGGIADAIGRHNVIRAGAIIMFVSGIFYLFSYSIWILLLAQILSGIGQMGVWLIVQVLITEEKNQEQSHARLATFTLYMSIGQMIAPLMGGWLAEHLGYSAVFTAYVLLCMILIYSCWKTKDCTPVSVQKISLKRMYHDSGKLMKNKGFVATILCTFIVMFITDIRITSLPIYLQSLNMTPTQFGFLVSLGSISALFVKTVFPFLMNRLGSLKLLILTYSVALCLLFFTPFLANFYSLAALIFITGMALGINQPLTLTLIAEQTAPDQRLSRCRDKINGESWVPIIGSFIIWIFGYNRGIFYSILGDRGDTGTFQLLVRFDDEQQTIKKNRNDCI
jgi:MFS family permease